MTFHNRLLGSHVIIAVLLIGCERRAADMPHATESNTVEDFESQEGSTNASEALAIVLAFHGALAKSDSATAIGLLHPDAVIFENGHAESVDEYRAGHLAADVRFATRTHRQVTDESLIELGSGVLYQAEMRYADSITRSLETMLLVPAEHGQGWLIRHIHWSSHP